MFVSDFYHKREKSIINVLYKRIRGPGFPATRTAFMSILTVSWLDGVNLLSETVNGDCIDLFYFKCGKEDCNKSIYI